MPSRLTSSGESEAPSSSVSTPAPGTYSNTMNGVSSASRSAHTTRTTFGCGGRRSRTAYSCLRRSNVERRSLTMILSTRLVSENESNAR